MITRSALLEPFLGRREELAFLLEKRRASLEGGTGSTVLVVGDAGIGKSRLMSEFARKVSIERGLVVRVACDEMSARPFGPFLDAFARLERSGDAAVRDVIAFALAALQHERAVVVDSPAEQRLQRYAALQAALEASARDVRQLALVIEDLHWIDATSLDVLPSVVALAERAPLLLVLTARGEDLERDLPRANALARIERAGVDRIRLGGIPRSELLKPLQHLVPDAPPSVVERIFELSEGKPYVAEELARGVIEHGGRSLSEVPITLRGALLERFAYLAPSARAILRRASVFGSTFDLEDVLLLPGERDEVVDAFRAARDVQLVSEHDGDFRFRHAIVREILYRELPASERGALHRDIADALETSTAGARLGEVAFHRRGAGDLGRARVASLDAGERARSIGAFSDAADHFRFALEATADRDLVAETAVRAIAALAPLGRIDDAIAVGDRATELLGTRRARDRFDVHLEVLRTLIFTARVADMAREIALLRDLTLTPEIDAGRRFDAECLFCDFSLISLAFEDARASLERANALVPERSDSQENRLLSLRGNMARLVHRYDDAHAVFVVLRNRASEQRNEHLLASTLGNLGFVGEARGALREGLGYCREAAAMYDRLGLSLRANNIRAEAALLAAMLGDFPLVRRLEEAARKSGGGMGHAIWRVARMKVVRACGGDTVEFVATMERPEIVQPYVLAMTMQELPWMLDRIGDARALFDRRRELVGNMIDGERPFLYAMATLGNDRHFATACDEFAQFPVAEDPLGRAWTPLLTARIEDRRGDRNAAIASASDAAARFAALEMPIERAQALCLARETNDARRVLRAVGAEAEIARIARVKNAEVRFASTLSAREREIARLVCDGRSNAEIAADLKIALRTVETHLANAYKKLGVRSRFELAERGRSR